MEETCVGGMPIPKDEFLFADLSNPDELPNYGFVPNLSHGVLKSGQEQTTLDNVTT